MSYLKHNPEEGAEEDEPLGAKGETFGRARRGCPERAPSGLTLNREAGLIQRAINGGWLAGKWWPTWRTREELEHLAEQRPLTFEEQTVLQVHQVFDSDAPPTTQLKWIRVATAMEAQNQKLKFAALDAQRKKQKSKT